MSAKAAPTEKLGRPNQKSRTRKDLLQAASRLMRQGREPSLEDVAGEALVSRATAYRYFPSVEALLIEASLDIATPQDDEVFDGVSTTDPIARLERVDTALERMITSNEPQLRRMLIHSLQRSLMPDGEALPARQNRRTPLIESALEPARKQFKPASLELLTRALALIIGTEAMVVFKDVLRIGETDARKVKRFVIRALVEAAKKT